MGRDDSTDVIVGLVKLIVVVVIIAAVVWVIGSYRIDTGQGAILTQTDGKKVAVTDTGWHWRLRGLTDVEIYSVVNNRL